MVYHIQTVKLINSCHTRWYVWYSVINMSVDRIRITLWARMAQIACTRHHIFTATIPSRFVRAKVSQIRQSKSQSDWKSMISQFNS